MIRVHERDLQATKQVDGATRALVPVSGALGKLPTDPKHLETMFIFCTNNWRTYSGEKPTGDKLVGEGITKSEDVVLQLSLYSCIGWFKSLQQHALSIKVPLE